MYASTLSKAFTDMEVCGEAVPESRKVRVYLAGIYHASLFAAKGIVSATPHLNNSFDNTVNFIAEEYDKVKTMTPAKRNVSVTNVMHKKNKQQLGLHDFYPGSRHQIASLDTASGDLIHRIESTNQLQVAATTSRRRKGTVSAQDLARRWHISLEIANKTIDSTSQNGVRDFAHMKGSRRLRHLTQQLAYRPLNAICYTDTMISAIPSLHNKYNCAQIYVTDFQWTKVYPMRSKGEAPTTLDLLHNRYGCFREMIPDNAKELTSHAFNDKLRRAGTVIRPIEAYTPNQNKAEAAIRELKRMYRRAMVESKAPEVLWDHCFELMAEIRSHTSLNLLSLEGQTPYTKLLGDTCDISHLCQFKWYEWVWWIDPVDKLQNRKLGRYLWPSLSSGDVMCSKVLTSKATVKIHSPVFPLNADDRNSEVIKAKQHEFEKELSDKLRDRIAGVPNDDGLAIKELDSVTPTYEDYEDERQSGVGIVDADEYDHDAYDKYISAKVWLPDGDGIVKNATVRKRKRDDYGNLIGHTNKNPILDTSLYDVEFTDGTTGTYTANTIAENIYEQIDDDGNSYVLFDSIFDHRRASDAVSNEEALSLQKPLRTTRGWKLCVLWKDNSTSWVPLKDLKDSHPIQVAEYAVAHKLVHEPAFSWWVPWTLKKRNRIISATKSRYLRKDQKFGIELPHGPKGA
jgi:hypothetical protein